MMADLRMQGVRPLQLARMLLFQAVCLGVLASLVGLAVGDFLSRTIFHATPGYLSAAFPLGTQTVIGLQPLVLSFAGGVLATCLAAAPPLLDLRRNRAVDAVYFEDGEPGQALEGSAQRRLLLARGRADPRHQRSPAGCGPRRSSPATIGLAVATLLAIPFAFQLVVRVATRAAASSARLNMLDGRGARAARDDRALARARGHRRDRGVRLRRRRRLPQRPAARPLSRLLPVRLDGRSVGRDADDELATEQLRGGPPARARRGPPGRGRRAHLPGRLPGLPTAGACGSSLAPPSTPTPIPTSQLLQGALARRRRACARAVGSRSHSSSPKPSICASATG